MKDIVYFIILLILFGVIAFKSQYNTELEKSNLRKNDRISVLDSLYQNQAQINLILRSYINDSEQEELQNDTTYLNLTTKTL
jgi:hypothetical protein